ncbi:MAG: hypothetical protein Q8J76_11495, partial [Desulfobulbaceae bacterium]|nr:hypothetical protein [Desulfobulbaceae bacterium]
MLTTVDFFDLADFRHQAVFDQGPVWNALKGLKSYMDSLNYPAWNREIPLDQPLPATLVIIDGKIIPAKGLTLDLGDATKGKMTISKDGQILAGASVLMAGAILSGEKISLGRGVFVEAGALIKSPAVIDDYTEIRQGAYLRG